MTRAVPRNGVKGPSLARLSGFEGFARSLVTGVVPVLALEALGSKRAVSYAYLIGAAVTLLVTLNLGTLERRFERSIVLSAGLVFVVASAAVYALADGSLFVVGIALASSAASVFSACIALFLMDHVEKKDLARNESRRIAYHGVAWLVGPSLGLWLFDSVARSTPFLLSGAVGLGCLGYFWTLRVGGTVKRSGAGTDTSPFRTIPQFFRERRMRVSYAITTVRSIFWAAMFIYGPIYVVEAGLPRWVGGALLSFVSSLLLFSRLVGRRAEVRGVRWVVLRGFGAIAAGMVALAVIGDARPIGLLAWVFAALGGAALDVVGNIPFMRMVRPRDRVAMTSVFSTWREVSSLIAPALAAGAIALGSFRLFYLAVAALAVFTGLAASVLPRRL